MLYTLYFHIYFRKVRGNPHFPFPSFHLRRGRIYFGLQRHKQRNYETILTNSAYVLRFYWSRGISQLIFATASRNVSFKRRTICLGTVSNSLQRYKNFRVFLWRSLRCFGSFLQRLQITVEISLFYALL